MTKNNDENIQYLTKEGVEKLTEERRVLMEETRKEIAERLEQAKALGDLSENSEYSEAKEAQTANEMRIIELNDILQNAVLIENTHTGVVSIGARVIAKRIDLDDVHEFTIVGSEEADPDQNKISHESPIGKAMLGKKKGEEANVFTPRGVICYKIEDIL